MSKILLDIVTPDKLLLSKEVDEVICPGADGDFGVLPGHCQFLSTLRVGELKYRIGDEIHYMTMMWGFVDVTPARVTVLAEVAEKAEDIDIERAQAKVLEAEAKVAAGGSRDAMEAALTSLEKARLRKKVAERAKQRAH
ncbi:MAG: F0F1 ATP synthase subunit epsilon [Nitrospirae bacterium]|nr:MAG: F0F1 ATP synthase subunit epsilon [Nitrospirota bacterium]